MADNLGYSIFLEPTDVVRAFQQRGELRPTVRWSEMMHDNHAVAFTAAKVARLDLLRTLQTSIGDMLANGGTYEEWKSGILPDLQKAGWWGAVRNRELTGTDATVLVGDRRLRNIYNTNVRMSLAAGHWARIQRQKNEFPYLRYVPSTSEHKRRLHKEWYGVILPVDHPWWQTHFPPNGWQCKCGFEQVSERRMRRMGWTVTPDDQIPDGPPRIFYPAGATDPITVPAGIDPGFGYNPGTAHLHALADKVSNSITQAADAGLIDAAQATLRELIDSPAFEQFLSVPQPSFPVMVLGDDMRGAIGATARVAVISDETLAKQIIKRADLPTAIYRELPDLPQRADIIARDGDNVLIFARSGDGLWTVAVLKRTASGNGLFVQSVRQQNERSLRRLLKDTEIIVDRR
ncbi:phage minor head protein [Sphingobium aquiterrae]|uniref:phage head morphogenesis protein n=1 Tax=Sphingobium aquiterrae TaxID=2038656 RepID=UPI00301A5E3B